jgi:hypothetical protein
MSCQPPCWSSPSCFSVLGKYIHTLACFASLRDMTPTSEIAAGGLSGRVVCHERERGIRTYRPPKETYQRPTQREISVAARLVTKTTFFQALFRVSTNGKARQAKGFSLLISNLTRRRSGVSTSLWVSQQTTCSMRLRRSRHDANAVVNRLAFATRCSIVRA